jgi:hypothetical protein
MCAQRTPPLTCVADDYAKQIKILAPYKKALRTLGSGDGKLGPGDFDLPRRIAIRVGDLCIMGASRAIRTGNARDDEAEMVAGAPPRLLR